MKITFSHDYPKLHGQDKAQLLDARIWDRDLMHEDFIEYDTRYFDASKENVDLYDAKNPYAHYPLPAGKYIVLVFFGNKMIPFTTVRPWTENKEKYYTDSIREWFDIVIKEGK
jgi:hypothetical protein